MNCEEFFLKTRDGTKLFVRWHNFSKKTTIVALHGIAEHLGRHEYIPEVFGRDYNVIQFDLRHHGKSEGTKGDVEDFALFITDLEDVLLFFKNKKKMEDYFLFGHSMGALIVWAFLRKNDKNNLMPLPSKVFLCAPPVLIPGRFGKLIPSFLLEGLARLPLSVWVKNPFSIKTLSHNPEIEKNLLNDPLCFSSFSKRLLLGLALCSKNNFSSAFRPNCPVGVAIGSEDKIVYSPNVLHYFSKCGPRLKTMSFSGAYHELHNEIVCYRRPYIKFLKTFFLK